MKLGPAAGTLGAGLLMTHFGWRPVFLGIGLLSLMWLPGWIKWMPRAEAPSRSGGSTRVRDILRQRPFWATAAGCFCTAYPLYFTITWLPLLSRSRAAAFNARMIQLRAKLRLNSVERGGREKVNER